MNKNNLIIILLFLLCSSCETQQESPTSKSTTTEPVELEEMIGQMVMIGFRGMEVDSIDPQILDQIETGYVGGIILFDYDIGSKSTNRNIKSPDQVKALIGDVQKKSATPLLVAVDQEGGKVNRLKTRYGFPKSVSAKYLGDLDNLDSTKHYAVVNANTLNSLGFNLNFAPVVDLDINSDNPVIGGYERSFSDEAALVVKHAQAWIEIHDSLGIISTLKHFPGHGSSDADSHEGFTDITAYWSEKELLPFEELSKSDQQIGIMTAHVFNSKLDSIYPATLSKATIQSILRDDWNFSGLIFSDDLQMKAVNKLFDFRTIVKNSINAGVDILVFGNNLEYNEEIPQEVVSTVIDLINSGEISEDRIKDSYQRIMEAKKKIKK